MRHKPPRTIGAPNWIRGSARKVIWSCLAAVILYLITVFFVGYERVLASASRLLVEQWVAILLISFASFCVRFVRWSYMLGSLGHKVPIVHSLCYYLAGFALTTSPAKIGEVVRLWYLKTRHGVDYTASVSAFVMEQFFDLVIVAALGVMVIDAGGRSSWFLYSLQILILGLVLSLRFSVVRRFCLSRVAPLAPVLGVELDDIDASLIALLSLRVLTVGAVLGLVAWSMQGMGLYYLMSILGFETGPAMAISIFSFAMLIGAVSFMPGGLGSSEAALLTLMMLYGAEEGLAVTVALLCRLGTLWFAVLIGACVMIGVESGLLAKMKPASLASTAFLGDDT